ncbi:hypothetical protein H696_03014 [Fonticula alba]|uniref:tRNA-uridine aminocarboxypropyltransferase 1 n=1 Tax=Fonticula alba TaxID=691883 RepID=A0A058Z8N1_FONAL|nr:hypothetical protein H696_03014 [Fonticula alba]KCV70659.1 hypothetical protein H696_03014 [Fonticula alba]|eukprot:XP_009495175.1 hypothetical protein H696_03014 [Fonticula alba]
MACPPPLVPPEPEANLASLLRSTILPVSTLLLQSSAQVKERVQAQGADPSVNGGTNTDPLILIFTLDRDQLRASCPELAAHLGIACQARPNIRPGPMLVPTPPSTDDFPIGLLRRALAIPFRISMSWYPPSLLPHWSPARPARVPPPAPGEVPALDVEAATRHPLTLGQAIFSAIGADDSAAIPAFNASIAACDGAPPGMADAFHTVPTGSLVVALPPVHLLPADSRLSLGTAAEPGSGPCQHELRLAGGVSTSGSAASNAPAAGDPAAMCRLCPAGWVSIMAGFLPAGDFGLTEASPGRQPEAWVTLRGLAQLLPRNDGITPGWAARQPAVLSSAEDQQAVCLHASPATWVSAWSGGTIATTPDSLDAARAERISQAQERMRPADAGPRSQPAGPPPPGARFARTGCFDLVSTGEAIGDLGTGSTPPPPPPPASLEPMSALVPPAGVPPPPRASPPPGDGTASQLAPAQLFLRALALSPFDRLHQLIAGERARSCGVCASKGGRFYCVHCLAPVPLALSPGAAPTVDWFPRTRLPVRVLVIRHRSETPGRSTAMHLKMIAPSQVDVVTYPVSEADVGKARAAARVFTECKGQAFEAGCAAGPGCPDASWPDALFPVHDPAALLAGEPADVERSLSFWFRHVWGCSATDTAILFPNASSVDLREFAAPADWATAGQCQVHVQHPHVLGTEQHDCASGKAIPGGSALCSAESALGDPPSPVHAPKAGNAPRHIRNLILIDGTWSQAAAILRDEASLHGLPHVHIPRLSSPDAALTADEWRAGMTAPPEGFRTRRTPINPQRSLFWRSNTRADPDCVSSVEAVYYACRLLAGFRMLPSLATELVGPAEANGAREWFGPPPGGALPPDLGPEAPDSRLDNMLYLFVFMCFFINDKITSTKRMFEEAARRKNAAAPEVAQSAASSVAVAAPPPPTEGTSLGSTVGGQSALSVVSEQDGLAAKPGQQPTHGLQKHVDVTIPEVPARKKFQQGE